MSMLWWLIVRDKEEAKIESLEINNGIQNQKDEIRARLYAIGVIKRVTSKGTVKIEMCLYCKKYGHMKRECRKLMRKNINAPTSPKDDAWVLDSKSSIHVCFKKEFFHSFKKVRSMVSLCDGSSYHVRGIGYVKLKTPIGAVRILDGVNFLPNMRRNLISLSRLDSKGCQISLAGGTMEVTRRDSMIFIGKESHRLYQLMGTTLVDGLISNDDRCTSSGTDR
ncbi:uncharacterized protein LOC131162877 [Malania oleifera]|uniref:uncharacterized protein LOC131162877 n=1 Tax=Malania oleifera TaxID=397392 RepID=UPI0025AE29F8|nr:uncharacterized protein LOC131162877 [Malania oleifera]